MPVRLTAADRWEMRTSMSVASGVINVAESEMDTEELHSPFVHSEAFRASRCEIACVTLLKLVDTAGLAVEATHSTSTYIESSSDFHLRG
jgi:hypothetical protein